MNAGHFRKGNRSGGRWSEERKRALVALAREQGITLNGEPARICLRFGKFAFVEQVVSGLGTEWSWAGAAEVIARGGAFRS